MQERPPDKLTSEIHRRAQREETTVHGALSSALALAFQQISPKASGDPVRIWSPIDIRKCLGLGEDCAVLVTASILPVEPEGIGAFWKIARAATDSLREPRSRHGIATFMSNLRQTIPADIDVEGAARIMSDRFAYDLCLANLESLPFEIQFKELKLAQVWGPAGLAGFKTRQIIGVATTSGAINLLQSSHAPMHSLLELTRQMLVLACL